ncbi:MAG: hypothetical protein JW839_20215 [Candidatus Lokiarchaeota archaeon]|nr:hypothetical protein [Candidatus Lokiarchaeota archaeon]
MAGALDAIMESLKRIPVLNAMRKRIEIATARALILVLPAKFEMMAERVSTYIKQEFFALPDSKRAIAMADAFVRDHAGDLEPARSAGHEAMLRGDLLAEMAQVLPGIRSAVGRWLYCKYVWYAFKQEPFTLPHKRDKGLDKLLVEMYVKSIDAIREPKSFEEILDCASGSYVALGMYSLNEKKVHAILSTVFYNTFIQGGIGPRKHAGARIERLIDAPVRVFVELYANVKRKLFEAYAREYGIAEPEALSNGDLVRVVRVLVQDKKREDDLSLLLSNMHAREQAAQMLASQVQVGRFEGVPYDERVKAMNPDARGAIADKIRETAYIGLYTHLDPRISDYDLDLVKRRAEFSLPRSIEELIHDVRQIKLEQHLNQVTLRNYAGSRAFYARMMEAMAADKECHPVLFGPELYRPTSRRGRVAALVRLHAFLHDFGFTKRQYHRIVGQAIIGYPDRGDLPFHKPNLLERPKPNETMLELLHINDDLAGLRLTEEALARRVRRFFKGHFDCMPVAEREATILSFYANHRVYRNRLGFIKDLLAGLAGGAEPPPRRPWPTI